MTSRKRKNISTFSSINSDARKLGKGRPDGRKLSRNKRRRHILETLEPRQLLAGPQLIGIQPNVGELIVEGSNLDTAPRALTLRFDQDQNIDPSTFDGVKISRAGDDGQLGTSDDIVIQPGLVTLADNAENEVIVRFSETLPDDQYQVEVFGYDDASQGVVGLRNTRGELLQPRVTGQRIDTTRFNLKLGALIEAVIPQPVIRQPDGTLRQNRDEIVVYFNEDPMFVENDESGNPTIRSVEHPRFYQLFLTQGTVRNTDDAIYQPEQVVYDSATHTARLIFAADLNELPSVNAGSGPLADADTDLAGVGIEGGTFRLRIGTAVDERVDVILPPMETAVVASAVVDFGVEGLSLRFAESSVIGEGTAGRQLSFIDTGAGALGHTLDGLTGEVVFNLGGASPTVQDLIDYIADPDNGLDSEISLAATPQNTADLSSTLVPGRLVGSPATTLVAVGDTLESALDVGVFGQGGALTSLLLSETIDPQTVVIQPIGSDTDPGSDSRFTHINPDYAADVTAGVTDIAYNFQGIFATDADTGTDYLNQITEVQKTRIREALDLWASKIGVQFRETSSDGITFAVGDHSRLEDAPTAAVSAQYDQDINAFVRIPTDPNGAGGYADAALVFDKSIDFNEDYGEDFTRKSVAGIGFLLGLEQVSDLVSMSDADVSTTNRGDLTPTIMGLNSSFLNASIESLSDLEPVFPSNYDVVHGQYLHRTDSVDIDLFRFVVDLDDPTQVGTLTAETFSERLADSSLLDTELTLFEEVSASVTTDFGLGSDMVMQIESLRPGRLGNNAAISFVQSDRGPGDTEIRVLQALDQSGNPSPNGILVNLPRLGPNVSEVLVSDLVDAINNHPFASSIFRATVTVGDASTDIGAADLTTFSPLLLSGGGIEKVHRNDDYFGEDSRIVASLGEGVYYLGVAASGNDQYDPTIPGTGNGGRTQGDYELHLKFQPQVDELDVLRDEDSSRVGVPGTAIDGDGDGVPGGVNNFWFETRALERRVTVEGDGQRVEPGQVMEIVSGNGIVRQYEFVTVSGGAAPGNIEVLYSPLDTQADLAAKLEAAINGQTPNTGVSVTTVAGVVPVLEFSGERSIELSNDFGGMEIIGRTIFVDKLASPFAEGTLARPFNNIANSAVANAFGSSSYGDIVRIVGNGGIDGDITTESDNFSYQIGTAENGGAALTDGRSMNVPSGVTTMIDAGAAFKLRNSYINVGSSTVQIDRSNGALQVLGTPRLLDLSLSGDPVTTTLLGEENQVSTEGFSDGSVIFTSTRDRSVDQAASGSSPAPDSGNWGGLIFRRDVDRAEGRRDREDDGIFLQTVNHAEIRYGGGSNVLIDSVQQLVNPIQIVDMRPNVTFNQVTFSADSAISAAPNSFEETSFQAPQYQRGGDFTADYDRVGPDIHNNLLVENSINGLFVRVTTTPVDLPKEFTVAARLDDTDVVHYVAENLKVAGSPGGSIRDDVRPTWQNVTWQPLSTGQLSGGNTYNYKLTYVDADGFESLASDPFDVTIPLALTNASVELTALPTVGGTSEYVSRRLYREDPATPGEFYLVAYLDAGSVSFIDDGSRQDAFLDPAHQGIRGRVDASLVMDAGLIVKLRGSRIELGHGTQFLAEADATNPVIFTSSLDDRYGVGGTFDTNNDEGETTASRGDWSGIYAGPNSTLSFDNVILANAGGISLLRGGLARGFAPIELTQAEGRITNSRFETNDTGQDGAGPAGRFGLLSLNGVSVTDPANRSHVRDAISTIMVRGSQPVIVGNTFYDNRGTIINIDIESLGANHRVDPGRATGEIDRFSGLDDNYGPLVRQNRYENVVFQGVNQNDSNSQLSGLEVRGGHITTETIFDDTDIAHLVFDTIEVGNFHSSGGLRLMSRPDESLVVKFSGLGTPNSANEGTGITASGEVGNTDRIGGAVHVLGLPGAPVVLTSIHDDSVGAGMSPDGSSFTDHDGDGVATRAMPNDWRGLFLDQNSNDNNILVLPELELLTEVPPGLNSSVDNAQYLGELAKDVITANHARRAGFEVQGYLGGSTDIDAYSFTASPGTPVWVDIDATSFALDTVIEILDAEGNVLARSDNSFAETATATTQGIDPAEVTIFDSTLNDGVTRSLQVDPEAYAEPNRNDFGLYDDFGSYNLRDAGIHLSLPGNSTDPSARSVYFLRVRSASLNPDDAGGGITGGHYRMQLRLTEEQAFPGSLVRFADIRYANQGIHVQGLMSNSPLLGEVQENEVAVQAEFAPDFFTGGFQAYNNTVVGGSVGSGAQYVGNLSTNDRGVIGIGGTIGNPANFLNDPSAYNADDVDFYHFDVSGLTSTVFDVDFADGFDRYDTNISVFYDEDGAPQAGELSNDAPRLVFFGTASNVLDDLPTALGPDSELEQLIRGSLTSNDPFIGPVTLGNGGVFGTGTFYVAITEAEREPTSLELGPVVREPINSVTRLVEDRFADEASTTDVAGVTVFDLFNRTDGTIIDQTGLDDTLPWELDQDNLTNLHGKPSGFLTTTVPNPSGTGTDTEDAFVTLPPTPAINPAPDPADEYDPDDANVPPPTNLDVESWSLVETDTIGTVATLLGGADNTSTTVPHLSVNGTLSATDPADFYQFSIPAGQLGELTVDIDGGFDLGASIDTKYVIWSIDALWPAQAPERDPLIGSNEESLMVEDGMLGSLSVNDPFGVHVLPGGSYLLAMMGQQATVTYSQDNTEITVAGEEEGDYIMRLSLDTKVATTLPPDGGGFAGDSYLWLNRNDLTDESEVTFDEGFVTVFTEGLNEITITNINEDPHDVRFVDEPNADPLADVAPVATFDGFTVTVTYNSAAATATNADYAAIVGAINGLGDFTAAIGDPASNAVAFPSLNAGYFDIDYTGGSATIFIANEGFFGPLNANIEVTSAAPGISDFTIVFDDTETADEPPVAEYDPITRTITVTYNPLATPVLLNSYELLVAELNDLPEFDATLGPFEFGVLPPVVATTESNGIRANYVNNTSGHEIEIENTESTPLHPHGRSFRLDITEVPGNAVTVFHDTLLTGSLVIAVGEDSGATYQDLVNEISAQANFTATLLSGSPATPVEIGVFSTLTSANTFDLSGYVDADQPYLYFNRLLELGIDDTATISLQSAERAADLLPPVELIAYTGFDNSTWDQERIDLTNIEVFDPADPAAPPEIVSFAGQTDIEVSITYTAGIESSGAGMGIDDVIVGFAERGEQIFGAVRGTSFVDINPLNDPKPPFNGEYQLEIRKATEFASGSPAEVVLENNFDTNHRLAKAITMVVPDLSEIGDGDTFLLSDGVSTQVFEFDVDDDIEFGNIKIDMAGLTTVPELAGAIRDAINGQSVIAVEATTSGGLDTEAPTGNLLALSGVKFGSFEEATLGSSPLNLDNEDHLLMPAIFYDAKGDTNFERTQGVVLIEHNEISDVRGIGVWAEPGMRELSPYQDLSDFDDFFDLYFAPPTANAKPGGVINLPELNDHVLGGLAPGIVIQSNTIDQAEYAGIKIDGQTAPWVIETGTGDTVVDGSTFVIDAAGTRVVFEFEEIGDGAKQTGAATHGGDGIKDGHAPVYYRHNDDNTGNGVYLLRGTEYDELEMVHAIREAIQGSILMTNGLVELVEVSVGPSLTAPYYSPGALTTDGDPVGPAIVSPALYIEGATAIYPGFGGIPDVTANITAYQAPVAEAPQPFARIVNNTIFGDDGTRTATVGSAAEPNDLFVDAVDTRLSGSHRDTYTVTATLGDNGGGQAATTDVDFYRVYLEVGDRLLADISTSGANAPETSLQIFDASGSVQLAATATVGDPSLDFVATTSGIYFVGVSSRGNESYSGRTLANRQEGFGGVGTYQLSLQSFAPRSFVVSFENPAPNGVDDADIDQAAIQALVGTTFTVTTVEDIPAILPQGSGTNQVTFRFSGGGNVTVNNGVVNVPIDSAEVHDLMKGIEAAINFTVAGVPVLPNYDFSDFPNTITPGAVRPGSAKALGGVAGQTQVGDELPWYFWEQIGPPLDNNLNHPENFVSVGMGHDNGSALDGSTELYALIENVARIELSQAARDAGLRLDPIAGEDADQLLNETGVMIAGGASPTILNNVFMNLHEAVAVESTTGLLGVGPGRSHPKPSEVVVVGNVFQDNFLNDDSPLSVTAAQATIGVEHNSLTGIVGGTSNVNGGSDDFNVTLGATELSLQNPEANNFQPAYGSEVIDASVNSLIERDQYAEVRETVGLGVTNVLAPTQDVSGVLRADHPDFASPGGIGASVFKDRGSVELADFVGPIAIAEMPRDNDAAGVDSDSTVSVINLKSGTYKEFRIQLRDNGDSSDPFTGIGIDDSTVVVPVIEGLRPAGSNVTLLENDRLLREGVDYTFFYDETRKLITLTPLTGVWQEDRSYRIEINNEDRNVLVAPAASEISDGDFLTIFDNQGREFFFEFESGYSLILPDPITLVVPREGTSNTGGIQDGDTFELNDGRHPPVIFEFDSDGVKLGNTVRVELPTDETPVGGVALRDYLREIADNIKDAIDSTLNDPNSPFDFGDWNADLNGAGSGGFEVRVEQPSNRVEPHIIIGGEAGSTLRLGQLDGLSQLNRTLALSIPDVTSGLGSLVDGDFFDITIPGVGTTRFEFDTDNNVSNIGNIPVSIGGLNQPPQIAVEVRNSIAASGIGLVPTIEGNGRTVFLGLPSDGAVSRNVGSSLEVVGLNRPVVDGDLINVLPPNSQELIVFEMDRQDELSADGEPFTDSVEEGNLPVEYRRGDTAAQLSTSIANALLNDAITAVDQEGVSYIGDGLLAVGGLTGTSIEVVSDTISLIGSPSITGSTTISVAGPTVLSLPGLGGVQTDDGSILVLTDDFGDTHVFEMNLGGTQPVRYPDAIPVPYNFTDSALDVSTNLANAINNQLLAGLTATVLPTDSDISFGLIEAERVNVDGLFDPTGNTPNAPGLNGAFVRVAIVGDGEIFEITQGATTVRYEFESITGGGGVQPGNIPVPFEPGSDTIEVGEALHAVLDKPENRIGLDIAPELEEVYDPSTNSLVKTGRVILNDIAGTVVNVTLSPTLQVEGVAGGANPIYYSPSFDPNAMKLSIVEAINAAVVDPSQPDAITASDRGAETLFVSNAEYFGGVAALGGTVPNYFLPGIKDQAGNLLKSNREDLTTKFTILMPTALFDYGDAPDPLSGIAGRYPTQASNDGARHVVGGSLTLGTKVDSNPDGLPGLSALGDDVAIVISSEGALFTTSFENGEALIEIDTDAIDPLTRDGDTITIDLGNHQTTLEFDVETGSQGAFNEDHYAIRPEDPTSAGSIAEAIRNAIIESPLTPAGIVIDPASTATEAAVRISADDEDGVTFTSEVNPDGVINAGLPLIVDVNVSGSGILEAWIDFNADGDWDDPGEQIIPQPDFSQNFSRVDLLRDGQSLNVSNSFTGENSSRSYFVVMPDTTPLPIVPTTTYARFRVSADGGLSPTGLALSGEVEDYAIQLLPGLPPEITEAQSTPSFSTSEDVTLVVDAASGLLNGIIDPDGDDVRVYGPDVGTRTVTDEAGETAGEVTIDEFGAFTFVPEPDYFGTTSFSVRVTDLNSPFGTQLVSPKPLDVTVVVDPVNDAPFAPSSPVSVAFDVLEDEETTFTAAQLIDPYYQPGPANESDQGLIFFSASFGGTPLTTEQGGVLSIDTANNTITYTPPADYVGADSFEYVVSDQPADGQTPQLAAEIGNVEITLIAVNDPPRPGVDNVTTPENTPATILIADLLSNDDGGPADEPQGLLFVSADETSLQGGTITEDGAGNLIYTPPTQFFGVDEFNYTVSEDPATGGDANSTAQGKVIVTVELVNDPPAFIGADTLLGYLPKDGENLNDDLSFTESKADPQVVTYDLNTWFTELDGEPMTFSVSSADSAIAIASIVENPDPAISDLDTLRLELPSYAGSPTPVAVTLTAFDSSDPVNSTAQAIDVFVEDTPDAPQVIGPIGTITDVEDAPPITQDLTTVFFDPDGDSLSYSVTKLGTLENPTAAEIAAHPLVQAITFTNDVMEIQLQENANGSVQISIEASDGTFDVTDQFTLEIQPVQDAPVAAPDSYFVPLGSNFQITNVNNGLLANDFDPDGDSIEVDLASVTQASRGSRVVNADGTFEYSNQSGSVGDTDQFTYRVTDGVNFSDFVTVSFVLTPSEYQNPAQRADVNADGQISAIDALLVINFLNRNLDDVELEDNPANSVPVGLIGTPPPSYLDVNGDGRVSALDALNVINELRSINNGNGEGEALLSLSATTGYASMASQGLPVRNLQRVEGSADASRDEIFAGSIEVDSQLNQGDDDWFFGEDADSSADGDTLDEALSGFLDDGDLPSNL